jgi:hypothetical protein
MVVSMLIILTLGLGKAAKPPAAVPQKGAGPAVA